MHILTSPLSSGSDADLLLLLEDSPRVCIWEAPYQPLAGAGRTHTSPYTPPAGTPTDAASAGTQACATLVILFLHSSAGHYN